MAMMTKIGVTHNGINEKTAKKTTIVRGTKYHKGPFSTSTGWRPCSLMGSFGKRNVVAVNIMILTIKTGIEYSKKWRIVMW